MSQTLPKLAKDIADIIGLEGLSALVNAKGGQTVCIPKIEAPEHSLADVLGGAEWDKLRATFAGEAINIPMLGNTRTALLHADIVKNRRSHTVNELAARYRLSSRQIKRICANARLKANKPG